MKFTFLLYHFWWIKMVISKWRVASAHFSRVKSCAIRSERFTKFWTSAPCRLRGWKNRSVQFPGRMSYKATRPGSVCPRFLSVSVVLLSSATLFALCYFVLFMCSVSWLFFLGCQYQCKWLTRERLVSEMTYNGDVKNPTHSVSHFWMPPSNMKRCICLVGRR